MSRDSVGWLTTRARESRREELFWLCRTWEHARRDRPEAIRSAGANAGPGLPQLLSLMDEAAGESPVEFLIGYRPVLDLMPDEDRKEIERWNQLQSRVFRLSADVRIRDEQTIEPILDDVLRVLEEVSEELFSRLRRAWP